MQKEKKEGIAKYYKKYVLPDCRFFNDFRCRSIASLVSNNCLWKINHENKYYNHKYSSLNNSLTGIIAYWN